MERSIFRYIFRYSRNQQILLLIFVAISFPFLYLYLQLPKEIINRAIGGQSYQWELLGRSFEQIPYLMILSGVFLALVLVNGGFKYFINVYRGVVAERMLRRLRYQLIERVMRFPLARFRDVSEGEVVAMVTTETEPLGGFIGDAFSLPAFQGGTALTILIFMFVQDPVMGIAAIALYPIQAYIIPKLQRQVNELAKERVRNVRKLSERLAETVAGVREIRAHNTNLFELADFSERLGRIYDVRYRIYRKKFFIKFLNNFLGQLTPFFFFSIGGYLVITTDFSFGALVAVLAAYKDLSAPWKELLTFYQRKEDARIKYEQLIEQFELPDLQAADADGEVETPPEPLGSPLVLSNVAVVEPGGHASLDGVSFSMETGDHVALVGPGGGGKSRIAQLVARQIRPSRGRIVAGGRDFTAFSDAAIGTYLAYVDREAYIRSGTIADCLLYGLKHRPVSNGADDGPEREKWRREAEASGNTPFDLDDQWIDTDDLGGDGTLPQRQQAALRAAGLEDDVLQMGLATVIDPHADPDLAAAILEARALMRDRLADPDVAGLVETLDADRFNTNATVAENLLFGKPIGTDFEIDRIGDHEYVQWVLDEADLTGPFLDIGRSMAALMIELFGRLEPDHPFFEQFSFVDADDLPDLERAVRTFDASGATALAKEDRARLLSLPFKLIDARHHIDDIDAPIQARILEARRIFRISLPPHLRGAIEFFDADRYHASGTIQENILFGKIAAERSEGAARIGALTAQVIEDLGLREAVTVAGTTFDVGIAGRRLTAVQRQKLAIARCLLKNPQLMVVNEATASLDSATQARIFANIKEEMADGGLLWVDDEVSDESQFDRVLLAEHGRIEDRTADRPPAAPEAPEVPEAPAPLPADEAPPPGETTPRLDQNLRVISGIPIFAGLDTAQQKLLAFACERRVFAPGARLMRQGDVGETAYVIVSGDADVIVDTPSGPITLATVGRGQVVGELALLSEAPRTATVRANVEVVALRIHKDVFFKLVTGSAQVSAGLTRMIANRLTQTLATFAGGSPELYDVVTGLPNVSLFKDRLMHTAAQGKREGRVSALVLVKLGAVAALAEEEDDTLRAEVLKGVSSRLRQCLREGDTIGRLESVEFGIIANASASAKVDTDVLTQRLRETFDEPLAAGERMVPLKDSLDLSVYPIDDENVEVVSEQL